MEKEGKIEDNSGARRRIAEQSEGERLNSVGLHSNPNKFECKIEDKSEVETDGRGPWYCYILRNTQSQYRHLTYNGSTNNPVRRLRQHNEEICGGARYTHGRNGNWQIYALLTGFPDHKNALSCEWRIKHTNGKPGKRPDQHCGVAGRIIGLNEVLKLPKWTKPCTIENKDVAYTLYIAEDVAKYIVVDELPENITVIRGVPTSFAQTPSTSSAASSRSPTHNGSGSLH